MAGNVKEWCWNKAGGSKRYILGGAWNEPGYMFSSPDAQSPFNRLSSYGFRCVKYLRGEVVPEEAFDDVSRSFRDYSKVTPVPPAVFETYKSMYSYDKDGVRFREVAAETSEDWRHETVEFKAAYGNETMTAHLFLPRNAAPPYQTVVFFPGAGATRRQHFSRDPTDINWIRMDFLVKSGRAVLWPIYKGTYERSDGLRVARDRRIRPRFFRDHVIQWGKDLARSIDYLEHRGDIDHRLAYYGGSLGASLGVIFPALEGRLEVCVLDGGGFFQESLPPEVDQITFAPRVKIPVLMLNGQYDFIHPVETAQLPMFHRLGTPKKDKRHRTFETGHWLPHSERVRQTLAWLDKYLGPVKRRTE